MPTRLNNKCRLELTIVAGTWFKDADMFGKQDPYVQWMYGKEKMQTSVKDEAGKEAQWDEKFVLKNIREQILNGEELVFSTFDEDVLIHDFIGGSRPIPWQDFCFNEKEKETMVDLYDKKKKKCGTLTFRTKFVFVKVKEAAKTSASISLWKGMSATVGFE